MSSIGLVSVKDMPFTMISTAVLLVMELGGYLVGSMLEFYNHPGSCLFTDPIGRAGHHHRAHGQPFRV
jgi:hypothetical protein